MKIIALLYVAGAYFLVKRPRIYILGLVCEDCGSIITPPMVQTVGPPDLNQCRYKLILS